MKFLKVGFVLLFLLFFGNRTVCAAPASDFEQETASELEEIQQKTENKILDSIDFSELDESISQLLPDEKIKFKEVLLTVIEGDW